ncbi:MAG: efflux RND transporter periplasmic adaptor subunit [Flavobacteriales bacterium]
MKTNNLVVVAFSFGIVWLLQSCSSNADKTAEKVKTQVQQVTGLQLTAKQQQNLGLSTGTIQKQSLGLNIFANGQIEVPPQNKSYISMPYGGYIKQIKVLDGMRVQKGQVLMTVEHPEIVALQQTYLEVNGELVFLESDYLRQKQLFEKEAGSAKNYQQAKSAYQIAKAKLSGLEVKLDMAQVNLSALKNGKIQREQSIRAPFSGVITKVTANVGAFADPKDLLMEIIDLKHAHAELVVYEKYLSFLRQNQQVQLNFIEDQTPVMATIFLIGSEISPERTVKVHCHFKKLPNTITPGSYLKASIQAEVADHWVLPNDAVVQYKGKDVVFIQNGTNFLPIAIDVILSNETVSAISDKNLASIQRAKIVTKGAYDLLAILNKEVE